MSFQPICCFKIKICFCESNNLTLYCYPRLDKYNGRNDWTLGESCNILRGKPFETHKTNPHDWLHSFIQSTLTTSILQKKKSLFQNNSEKINLRFDFINNLIFFNKKTEFRHSFIRWETNHSSNFNFKATKQFWTKTQKINKKCTKSSYPICISGHVFVVCIIACSLIC
jgi:hypothetical protein